jgi:aryl-alcohol dehydrogenase-like predicted oxidoreductase
MVSRLCLGTGTTGFNCQSAQSKTPTSEYGALLRRAHALGVTFWDTSDDYGTYPHVGEGLRGLDRASVTITSKTWALSARDARAGVEEALRELGTDYLDVFLLHEVDSPEELGRRDEALQELHRCKREGMVRAVGLSTHAILTAEHVVGHPLIEVVLTNYNKANLHMDANLKDYSKALEEARRAGQGTYVMKTLAEGKLSHDVEDALRFNLSKPWIDSVTVGIRSERELEEIVAIALRVDSVVV